MGIQSENVAIHREVTKRLDNNLQSMIVNCNELDHQLREGKLQNRLDREDFKRLIKAANQHSYSNPKDVENAGTGRQLAYSTELPGHDHVHTMMSKVKHRVSEIYHHPHENEDDIRRRHETLETPDDDKIVMTSTKFQSIMAKALEDQRVLENENTMQVAKVAFTEGVKQASEGLNKPNHSSSIGMASDSLNQVPVMTIGLNELQHIHQLRPETSVTMAPFTVSYTAPASMAANTPVSSTQHGVIDSNKTFQSVASFTTGKRYKRETNLKFSEDTVEQYESFRSQFNIHHNMLGWDTNRAGIELYKSLEGKAALKVEEVIINTSSTSNVAKMWDALGRAFLPIDHCESKYRQFAMRRWHRVRVTKV